MDEAGSKLLASTWGDVFESWQPTGCELLGACVTVEFGLHKNTVRVLAHPIPFPHIATHAAGGPIPYTLCTRALIAPCTYHVAAYHTFYAFPQREEIMATLPPSCRRRTPQHHFTNLLNATQLATIVWRLLSAPALILLMAAVCTVARKHERLMAKAPLLLSQLCIMGLS